MHSFSPYFNISGMSAVATLSATYVYQEYNTTRLQFVFEAFALVFGASVALAGYVNMRWKMNQLGDVQSKLQQIADQGN